MQAQLFYDDEFDALNRTITNSDRSYKEVAHFLFPHMKPESAYARLKASLNPEGDQRLTYGQIVAMCKFCRRFDALYFMCDELSHERPLPRAPEDERAMLQREFIESTRYLNRLAERIERVASRSDEGRR